MDSWKCRRWCKRILTRSSNASTRNESNARVNGPNGKRTNDGNANEKPSPSVSSVERIDLWNNNVSGLVRGSFPSMKCKCWKRNAYFIASVVIGFNGINSMKFNSLIFEKEGTNCLDHRKEDYKKRNSDSRNNRKFSKVSMIGRIIGKRFSNVSSRIKRFLLKISLLQYRRLYDFSAVGRTVLFSSRFAE